MAELLPTPPDETESAGYYRGFPCCLRLIARTSSTPWHDDGYRVKLASFESVSSPAFSAINVGGQAYKAWAVTEQGRRRLIDQPTGFSTSSRLHRAVRHNLHEQQYPKRQRHQPRLLVCSPCQAQRRDCAYVRYYRSRARERKRRCCTSKVNELDYYYSKVINLSRDR